MALGFNKRMKRMEKRKKKMVAFLAMAKLNDEDREAMKGKRKVESSGSGVQENENACSYKKTKEEDMEIVTRSIGDSPKKSNGLGSYSSNAAGTDDDRIGVAGGSSAVPDSHNYSDQTLDELRKAAYERKKKFQEPKFRLKECGEKASLNIPEEQRIPFFMVDVQHLIMWSLLGHHAPFQPSRMYQLLKYNKLSHTVLLMVDGVCLDDLKSASGILHLPSPITDDAVASSPPHVSRTNIFPWRVELLGPSVYGSTLVQDMATVPLSNTQYQKVIMKYGSLERAIKGKAIYKVFRGMFPIKNWESFDAEEECCEDETDESPGKDRFPRTRLLISADQMVQMGYPLPLVKSSHPEGDKQPMMIPNEMHQEKQMSSVGRLIQSPEFLKNLGDYQPDVNACSGNDSLSQNDDEDDDDSEEEMYVFSRPWYKEVGPQSPMFSLDCEMCLTGQQRSELTRIAIVNEELQVVYESLVKPHRKITNYLTKFSGITESMLKDVNTRLSDVQRDVRELLPPDAILVGQSLNFDLHALKMMHPYVIDTSIAFNLSGEQARRAKLATLAQLFLSETIQCHGLKGHNPIEDASAAMKLILLKLSKSISYGDASLRGQATSKMREKVKLLKDRSADCLKEHEGEAYGTSIFSHVKRGKHAAVVLGVDDVIKEYQKYTVDVGKKTGRSECSSLEDRPPKLISVENSSEAISRACEVMLEHQLCIVHLSSQSVGEKLMTLEEWCLKIVDQCAPNSMCIVVLGGAEKVNGACLIHLKAPE